MCNTWWMNVRNDTIFETIIIYIFRLVKYTKFHKAVEKYKRKEKKKIPTRVHIAASRVTSRAEYKPPLGMHAALSFKEVHEVGEWEIMPSTRFLSATGKHNLPPLFFSPLPFFFSLSLFLNFHFFLLSLPSSSFASLRLIDERRTAWIHHRFNESAHR